MARLFALDRSFPQPIVDVLADFQADAKLVSLDAIDPPLSMATFDGRDGSASARDGDKVGR